MDPAIQQALDRLVDGLVERGLIPSPAVEHAFRSVPRHLFLPGVPLGTVYSDEAIITKAGPDFPLSSSSQPAIMAIMLEQLALERAQNALEIGAGTGYNAALVASIIGPVGHVTTIEVDADTAAAARAHLDEAGFDRVEVVCADGRQGWPANTPYDRILATAAVTGVPNPWTRQLVDGGILVAPVGTIAREQHSVAFQLTNGELHERSSFCCGFMWMRDASPQP